MAYTSDNMLKSIDWITICIYLALVIFGWFSVCGASYDYGEIDFFSFDTRAGKQLVWISCSLGLGFILLMLEDKLYDMFAYIFYGAMMLLLLVTPFWPRIRKVLIHGLSLDLSVCSRLSLPSLLRLWLWLNL